MQAYVRCPFYRGDDGKNRISCEGIGAGSSLTSYYRAGRDCRRQMEVFCCRHFDKCEIARAIMEKYGE